jgi:endonuclease/exonuclease/phosphatase family metal-dependent hydrolase
VKKLAITLLSIVAAIPSGVPALSFPAKAGISVVTLNLAKEASVARIQSELSTLPALRDADVFLLQEVSDRSPEECLASRLGAAMGFQVAYAPTGPGGTDLGLAILSRFPLRDVRILSLPRYDLGFRTRSRYALMGTAETPWGPVRIANAHLDTRLNTADRLAQLEPVIRETAAFQGPRLIGGDFNSNPFYWVGRILPLPGVRSTADSVTGYMTHHGFRNALSKNTATFDHLGMGLDWIWLGGLRPVASGVIPLEFSDHHAVWTRLEF